MKEILADTSYRNLSAQVEKVNDNLANPFEKLTKLFNQNKLINIQTKNMTVKIPMIYREDINSYEIYLRQRADTNGEIIKERTERTESLIGICFNAIGKGEKNPPRREEEGQKAKSEKRNEYKTRCNNNQCDGENKDKEACKQHYCDMITCEETVEQKVKEMVDLSNDYENILDRINENILILQEYRNLPFELYERVHAIDRYVAEISAIMRNFFGYISYWMTTNANRFSSYVDAIILIMDVIKTYQVLIDFSVNWGNKCATCTNDTYDQHSCTLSLLCQGIKLPIIQIPNIKIPDIIIDFSELNLNMNILLPTFNFQPIKVDLPTIPNLPTPPIIDINFTLPNISLPSAPEIPELPAPPHLPELPSFIPNIKLELPVLPPAPQLPQIPHEFEATLKLAEKI
ncbi:MAG: hypothetical protein LBP53_08480 [Candidatus Peribacteria bacterium]|jgi:hypothetical protein|nr:hypothetical protein [Candidatus Peribacteria bacterium]